MNGKMSAKVLCPTLNVMLVKTIKALCEINIRYDQKLEISGCLHVRSDGEKVLTCLIDEETLKGASNAASLDIARLGMPNVPIAFPPPQMPAGLNRPPGHMPEPFMPPVQSVYRPPDPSPPQLSPEPSQPMECVAREETVGTQENSIENSPISSVHSRTPENMEAEVALAHAHARNLTSASTIRRQAHEEILAHLSRGVDTPKSPPIHAAFKLGPRPEVPNANQATQNHVKLPNIQTLAQSLPKFPLVKTETVDHPPATSAAITTEAKAADGATGSFPPGVTPPAGLPMQGFPVDPMVGVNVEVQSQMDAEGNLVHKKRYQCMFCGIFLSTKCYLKNHINAMHTKARVYPCELCERYFYSAGALRIHKLRNHWHGSKKHKCTHCGDTFLLPIELRKHLLKKHVGASQMMSEPLSPSHVGAAKLEDISPPSSNAAADPPSQPVHGLPHRGSPLPQHPHMAHAEPHVPAGAVPTTPQALALHPDSNE